MEPYTIKYYTWNRSTVLERTLHMKLYTIKYVILHMEPCTIKYVILHMEPYLILHMVPYTIKYYIWNLSRPSKFYLEL